MKKFVLLMLAFLTAVSFAAGNPITFEGHGEAALIPSSAEIGLTVSYKGPEVGELFGRLEAESVRVHDMLKKIGIPRQDIKDRGNKITQLYDNPNDTNVWERFMLSRKFLVIVHDFSLLDEVIAKAKEEEIDQIDGPIFDYPDRGKAENTAIENAIADAKKKAEAYYPGRTLGEPKIVSKTVTTLADPSGIPGQQHLIIDITASFN